MFIELTTGNDSFRAQGASSRRNVTVTTWVRVEDSGDKRTIIPMFEAYRKKLRYFRETNLVQQIPATSAHDAGVGGAWYINRHEVAQGTEILIEYKHRTGGRGSFEEEHEHFMIVADSTAPLWQVNLDLPFHHLAAVPNIQFRGRFEIVKDINQLAPHGVKEWLGHFDIDEADPTLLPFFLDPMQEDGERYFTSVQLEQRTKKAAKIETKIVAGKSRLKIRRSRAIRTN